MPSSQIYLVISPSPADTELVITNDNLEPSSRYCFQIEFLANLEPSLYYAWLLAPQVMGSEEFSFKNTKKLKGGHRPFN
jgi:hypothetical protein